MECRFLPSLLFGLYLFASCQSVTTDPLIAEVYNKKLYQSEADRSIPPMTSSSDSVLLRNAFIERWIRESLMMVEAEQNLPNDLALEELVEDYRSSMILHHYEKRLVEHLLDTIIPLDELQRYYDENKSQYILESVIARCRFIKIDADIPSKRIKEIEENWTTTDEKKFRKVLSLCNQYSSSFYLNDSIWHDIEEIKAEMPPGSVNNAVVRNNRELKISNDSGYFFLKILEVKDEEEIAPLTFIEEQASKVILHRRKLELLEKIKEDLYDRASSQNRIKVYTG
ncbi:MAG: hypothetical protein KTR24_10980 [Saprospiraceae bacterium]|nr:hypothetical protein [Saprospiraceae bacterium]